MLPRGKWPSRLVILAYPQDISQAYQRIDPQENRNSPQFLLARTAPHAHSQITAKGVRFRQRERQSPGR